MMSSKKSATKTKKTKMTAEQKAAALAAAKKKREETKFRKSVKEIFTGAGFQYIPSENKEFTLVTKGGSRTTELDGVFVYENAIVVVEDTCTASPGAHLASKQIIFDLAVKNKGEFIDCLRSNLPEFSAYINTQSYEPQDYVLKILYFSMHSVDSEHVESAGRVGVQVVERSLTNYFHSLVKNISVSAKYELLKFMEIPYSEIGAAKISGGNAGNISVYKGFLLPTANSSFPPGYKVVSFYIDPASLLKKSFVLRKNGWLKPNLSYQRILDMPKIKLMRKYLSENKRVYLGNVIATLPPSTKINDIVTADQLSADQQLTVKPVQISLPDEYNVVGLIDGQHRVYSYHEGVDVFDAQIDRLRKKQNLLVTGIIYPNELTDDERILFEAKLFLEINSKQTKVKSVLTQEIELIVNPFSATAIAKVILIKLAQKGVLKDKLEEHVFDDAKKLKILQLSAMGLSLL
jgi:DGQHR domain-containing protein